MTIQDFKDQLNEWASDRVPFLFVVDFEMVKPLAFRLPDVNAEKLLFDFNGKTNAPEQSRSKRQVAITRTPIGLDEYGRKFGKVYRSLLYGDTYLINLTVKTAIHSDWSLRDLFNASAAKYKLWYNEQFLVFSPETFVQIRDGIIYSHPMKGTIDAAIPNAAERILHDTKELAEHVTIVDLIRNDLSRIADQVHVRRFRYIDELVTNHKRLLQVSSEIAGTLPSDYLERLGDIIVELLPAGSVSGAPKDRTVQILREAEGEDRGYYTGIAGLFDGTNLDSGVMIRFIQKEGDRLYYKSGGGVTSQSAMEAEYKEAIDKVYVPVD